MRALSVARRDSLSIRKSCTFQLRRLIRVVYKRAQCKMALNKITSLFGKSKKKQAEQPEEPEDEPKLLARRYSYSKSGRMKAREYTRKTVGEISPNNRNVSGEKVELNSFVKRSEEVDGKGHTRKDSTDRKIDDIVKEMRDIR